MTFHEKLAKLMEDRTEVDVNRNAGLEQGYIGGCLAGQAEPGGFKVLKLARYFGVPVEWLLDDATPWPPPMPGLVPVDPADPQSRDAMVRALATLRAGLRLDES